MIVSIDTIIRYSKVSYEFPKINISIEIQDILYRIQRLVGRLEGQRGLVPDKPELRRGIRAQTVAATCAIEGNSLAPGEVFTLLSGRAVKTSAKDLREVKNANAAYEKAVEWNPWSLSDLKDAHRVLMQGLIADAGSFRKGQAGIFHGSTLVHMAPPAKLVSGLSKDMLTSLKKSNWPIPIKAIISHYELESIHPFADGNGRLGRLWQHVTLLEESEVFGLVPSETVIREQQLRYYKLLRQTDKTSDAHDFVLFGLEALELALQSVSLDSASFASPRERLEHAREAFQQEKFDRKKYLGLFRSISTATASRDLALGVKEGHLKRAGDKNLALYQFQSLS